MFKRILLIQAIVATSVFFVSPLLIAQSKDAGDRLFREARELQEMTRPGEDLTNAVEKYEEALNIFRKVGDAKGEGKTLFALGYVYSHLGQYDKAAQYYEQSLAIKRELKDRRGEGITLGNLGIVYQDWGQYAKAVEYYEKALAIKRELKDRSGEWHTLNQNLGIVYQDWGQYAKAVEYYEKALAISLEIKDRSCEEKSLTNLGIVYQDWGQHAKAVEYYERALAISLEIKDRLCEGSLLMGLGNIYAHRGEKLRGLANFQKGLNIYQEIGFPVDTPKKLFGDLYLDIGDLENAEPLLKQMNYDSSLGRLSLLKMNYPSARNFYESLLKSAEQKRNVDDLFTAYTGLGTAYEEMGDNNKAEECFLKAVDLTEDLRSILPWSQRETFFDQRINGFRGTAPYDGLARVRVKMNKPLEAFRDWEYTKSQKIAQTMSMWSESTSFDIPPDVLTKDRELNDQHAALKKVRQKAYRKSNQEVISVAEHQVKEMDGKLQTHIKTLREKYPLFAATKYPQPMDLSQSDLKDNEWVLAYHLTDSGIIVYLSHGKNLVKGLFKPIARKEVDDLVRKFRNPMELSSGDSLSEKLTTFDFTSGKKLSDLLLADILPDLPTDAPLIIVPDGSLGVVPFEMLVLNDGGKIVTENKKAQTTGAEFFGDRNPISYYQSITALTLARTLGKHQKAGEKTLAMVDPVFSADDPRLVKVAKQERDKLLANLPTDLTMSIQTESGLTFPRLPLTAQLGESLKNADQQQTDLYEGLNVKKTALLDKDLTPYKSLVFATHGYFGKDLPGIQEPVLVMSLLDQPKGQDGFLRLSEVMGLKLNCDIAALTACQTGLGRHISGEGTMGMGRAFQYAGAKSVLMSLWSVSETASVNLVENFFKHLKEGKSKLESLKLAREDIRKAGYDHPFYWAPFILVGEVN
jgi:CHAT domain-containing protein/Tfp pilus assembly protein PilF